MWHHESIGVLNALHCRLTVPAGESVIVVTKQDCNDRGALGSWCGSCEGLVVERKPLETSLWWPEPGDFTPWFYRLNSLKMSIIDVSMLVDSASARLTGFLV